MPARILLATADPTLLNSSGNALRREGYEILVCKSGADCLRAWNVQAPDLLVVDSALPDINGFEVVHRLRQAEAGSGHLPVVLVGPTDTQAKIAGLRCGADDYVVQPANPHELSARVRGLLVRFGSADRHAASARSGPTLGRVYAWYGAKGGVGTTTLAINTAIELRRQTKRSVALVDANLQFGDHRVFLDLGTDRRSIVDIVTAPEIDADVTSNVVVRHESGVDLLLAPPTPESAEHVSMEHHHLLAVVEVLRSMYDYVLVDLDERLDDHTLDVIAAANELFVVLTADLSCLKNVRLLMATMSQIGIPDEQVTLVLNRNKAFTGISTRAAESVLRRQIEHQVVNDYRTAISSLNSGTPFMLNRADSPVGRDIVALAKAISRDEAAPQPAPLKELVPAVT
jgi:pilus assembly protein CpaE